MKKEKLFFVVGLVFLLLITNNVSASISHGSMKGAGLLLYDQGPVGGNTINPVRSPTLDYKVVTIGTKTWAWIKSNGSTIDTGADWTSQLRYWSAANAKTENNMTNRNSGSNAATETWTKTSATMPTPVRLSFFNVLMTGGWAETTLISYDPAIKNSLISGDLTVPVVTSCSAIAYSVGAVTLSFSGSDNQGDLFYYVTGTGIEEVSFGNNITLSGLTSNTVYTITVTPIDFNGNEGLPITRTFKTMKSAGVSNIANNLGLNYNSISTNVSGGEYVSIIQQTGNSLTLGLTSASDVITSGAWRNRVLVNPSVRVDGVDYSLTLDGLSTSATMTFTETIGTKTIESGATLSIRWSVYNPGEFFTGTFTYTIGGADVEGPSTPNLSLVGNAINWSASTDAGSGVKGYEISEVGQPTLTIMDLSETTFSYTLVNSTATVSVKALDFVNNISNAASINNADNFRTKTSGNWNDLSNWEFSTNNADWSNASVIPVSGAASVCILNNHSISIDENVTTSSLYVNPRAKLTINTGKTLTANLITLNSDATGTATIIDDYNVPTINATVQQFVEVGRNWYVSSPVLEASYTALNRGDSVITFNEVTKKWNKITSGNLIPGKGYIQTAVNGHGTTGTVNFSGLLNSGNVSLQLSRTGIAQAGFNLVGNPYPSYLDWSKVATANTNVLPTLWFRTKKTTGVGYTFTTVNVATPANPIIVTNDANTTITKYIPPMQAYWVRLSENPSTTEFIVTNAMRDHNDINDNKFKAPKQEEISILRLLVSNGDNSDETVLYFSPNASNDFDRFDSPKMLSNSPSVPEIYTLAGDEKLVINGLNEIQNDFEIPIGFATGQINNFTLKSTEMTNFEIGTKILLIDKQNPAVETELSEGTVYNFSSQVTTPTTERFSLIFRAPGATTDVKNAINNNVLAFVNQENQIMILAPEKSNFTIYNAVGQKMKNGATTSDKTIINKTLKSGVYVVKVSTNGQNYSTRVIIK